MGWGLAMELAVGCRSGLGMLASGGTGKLPVRERWCVRWRRARAHADLQPRASRTSNL